MRAISETQIDEISVLFSNQLISDAAKLYWKKHFFNEWIVLGSSTFLVGKAGEIVFSGGAYDTGKDVSADIGAG
jgi:lysyl-tRNA synthetase class I